MASNTASNTASNMSSGSLYALFAGFLGAAASLSAKLSLGADYVRDMCESGLRGWTETHGGAAACDWVRRASYDTCVSVSLSQNAVPSFVSWSKFNKSPQYSEYLVPLTPDCKHCKLSVVFVVLSCGECSDRFKVIKGECDF